MQRQICQSRGHFENRLQKKGETALIGINVIFAQWIQWWTFTEKMRPIGEGPKFVLSVLTQTAS